MNNTTNVRSTWAGMLLALIVCAGAGAGCNTNRYTPPNLPGNEVARLSTRGALHLEKIDGQALDATGFIPGVTTSNQTTATPGRHELQFLMAFGDTRNYRMDLDLTQGSAYEFESIDLGRRVAVTNTTAGRRWEFDYITLTAFDPAGTPHPLSRGISP